MARPAEQEFHNQCGIQEDLLQRFGLASQSPSGNLLKIHVRTQPKSTMKHWVLLLCAIFSRRAAADDLSDFSNDLVTDVGPLLVLFGESMTRQYLSESTSFVDYFIFAMAPIGIITAIVSAIRVCGHSTLRAFIGRSQEGDGLIEAELCTSTSRDVCELFNKGGITRVLGRPCILELIHLPGKEGKEDDLHLFRHYLESQNDPESSEWTKVEQPFWRSAQPWNGLDHTIFAPKPNLSLNVCIKKRPRRAFIFIAVLGFILQAGVLALAGVGVWILGWNSTDYAPIMFITGTIFMCSGMWSCVALIGQTTQEVRYSRNERKPKSRLLWLQSGSKSGQEVFKRTPSGVSLDSTKRLTYLKAQNLQWRNTRVVIISTNRKIQKLTRHISTSTRFSPFGKGSPT